MKVLSGLTDKYFFSYEDFEVLAKICKCRVEFYNLESDEYYEFFMQDLLNQYRITDERMIKECMISYKEFQELSGKQFSSIFSHYKIIRMVKL